MKYAMLREVPNETDLSRIFNFIFNVQDIFTTPPYFNRKLNFYLKNIDTTKTKYLHETSSPSSPRDISGRFSWMPRNERNCKSSLSETQQSYLSHVEI